ncbi:hypothetical protein F1D61_13625 [Methylobacterium aquaticum]|nr:hypothetical protein F1D61_13625 [Methylobacterium aquaticum]
MKGATSPEAWFPSPTPAEGLADSNFFFGGQLTVTAGALPSPLWGGARGGGGAGGTIETSPAPPPPPTPPHKGEERRATLQRGITRSEMCEYVSAEGGRL